MALQRPTDLLTAEDIRDWPDDYELYDGVPRSVAAAPDVSAFAARIARMLGNMVDDRELGVVFGPDASFRMFRAIGPQAEAVYLPDVAFVTAERANASGALTYPFEGAPDLDVEVRTVPCCRAASRLVDRRRAARDDRVPSKRAPRWLDEDAMITGEDVLPDFAVPVSAFFQIGRPLPKEML